MLTPRLVNRCTVQIVGINSSRSRIRRRQAEGDSEIRSAKSRLLMRPSSCSTDKIRQSVASSENPVIFLSPCGCLVELCSKTNFLGSLFINRLFAALCVFRSNLVAGTTYFGREAFGSAAVQTSRPANARSFGPMTSRK